MNIVKASGVMERTKKLAQQYTDKAFKLIQKIPDNEYKDILLDVTKTLLVREY